MASRWGKRRIAGDSLTWTDVVADRACNGVALRNSDAAVGFSIRTTKGDSTTLDQVAAGAQEQIVAQPPYRIGPNFNDGDFICEFQLDSGTGPLIVTLV